MPLILAYWHVRGYAEAIRLMLEYLGVEYEDKRYHFGSTPETIRDEWLKDKFNLGMDFPNLPYIIDGDVRLSQSCAIQRYIARKHGLLGATEKDQIRSDLCEQQCVDFRTEFGKLVYNQDFDKLRGDYVAGLPDKLRAFDAFLGGKFDWFGGAQITFADFMMYAILNAHRAFEPHCLDAFAHLKAFMHRFEALPRVSAYLQSDRFKKTPINAVMAAWGGSAA